MILLVRNQWEQIFLVRNGVNVNIIASNGNRQIKTSESFANDSEAEDGVNNMILKAMLYGFQLVQQS